MAFLWAPLLLAADAAVIVLPGLAGSRLEAKAKDATGQPHSFCYKNHGWFNAWIVLHELLPEEKDCLIYYLNITYDEYGLHNSPGMKVRPVDFGGLDGVSVLHPGIPAEPEYFKPILDTLQANGYVPGKSLFGAPYDWRLGWLGHTQRRNDVGGLYPDLKALVEKAHASDPEEKVTLLSHSLGGTTALGFMHWAGVEWTQQHIARWVALGAPLGGSVKQLLAYTSGDNFGVPFFPPDYFRPIQVSAESGVWMSPIEAAFPGEVLSFAGRPYKAADIADLFDDLHLEGPRLMLLSQGAQGATLEAINRHPQVPCIFITGSGLDTMSWLEVEKRGQNPTKTRSVSGDGTVALQSAAMFTQWGDGAGGVQHHDYANVSHTGLLSDARISSSILEIVGAKSRSVVV